MQRAIMRLMLRKARGNLVVFTGKHTIDTIDKIADSE